MDGMGGSSGTGLQMEGMAGMAGVPTQLPLLPIVSPPASGPGAFPPLAMMDLNLAASQGMPSLLGYGASGRWAAVGALVEMRSGFAISSQVARYQMATLHPALPHRTSAMQACLAWAGCCRCRA